MMLYNLFQIGACGSAETAFAAMSLREGRIPPTLNVENVDDACDESLLKIVVGQCDVATGSNELKKLVLKNSFGFGGTNVSLLLAEFKN